MQNNELSLDVSNSSNQKIMRLYDTSFYYSDEIVDNYIIEVLPPNKSNFLTYFVAKGFSLVLNSANLRYKKVNDSKGLIDLPDGIYHIKQSYKPNLQNMNEFYHFRVVELMNRIQVQRSKLISDSCAISRIEYVLNREKLRDIEEYLKAAKWMVEEEHDIKKGKEMYEFTKELLEKYTNECQC